MVKRNVKQQIIMKQFIILSFLSIFIFSCNSAQKNEDKNAEEANIEITTPEGKLASYTYETYKVESSKLQEEGDTTRFQVNYPVFNDSKINDFIYQRLVVDSGKNSLEEIGDEFIHDYDEYYEQSSFKSSWYVLKNDSVVVQTKDYIGFKSDYESYTGGAHGNYYTNFLNYDVNKNKEFEITDFIIDDTKLLNLAETIFRKQEKLSENQTLSEDYFFENDVFSLPKNFILEKEGILFIYNIYEIKPYVSGQTELLIPYSSLENLLTPKAKTIIAEIKK